MSQKFWFQSCYRCDDPSLASYVFNAERVILSRVQVLASMVLKPRPTPMPAKIGYSLRRGRWGSLDCMWGCAYSIISSPGLFFYGYIESPDPQKLRRPHTTGTKPHQLKTPTPKIQCKTSIPKPEPQTSKNEPQ